MGLKCNKILGYFLSYYESTYYADPNNRTPTIIKFG